MTPTLEDYWCAVDSFVTAMGRLGDDLRGILLWGSLARGEVVLGQSDLLDAVVVVRRGLLEEPADFDRVVQQILAACAPLAESGLPFAHPPILYREEELGDFNTIFGPTLVAPDSSRLLMGDDLRPLVHWSDEGQAVARCAFFSVKRRTMDRLAVFLPPLRLSEQHQKILFDQLVALCKNFPAMACAALGRPASQMHALADLRQALPDLDFSLFDEIAAIRKGEQSSGGPEALQGLLRKAFDLAERVEEGILASATARWSDLLAVRPETQAGAGSGPVAPRS
ncbi:MAG: hypothetical protein QOF89_5956 [Acidobacteriota bacterium]|jgi:hypothetical protein|nr:hypothetical protein [Acidobacteriota bacterium]